MGYKPLRELGTELTKSPDLYWCQMWDVTLISTTDKYEIWRDVEG